jgi:VanZ family protein
MKRRKIILLPLLLSATIMVLIFVFSAQSDSESSRLSIRVTRFVAGLIFFEFSSLTLELQDSIVRELHGFVRKAAHFGIYALLGLNVFFTVTLLFKRMKVQITTALLICAAYAAFDEIHQLFRPGRGGSVGDVLIDISGSAFGIAAGLALFSIVYYIGENKK